MIENFVNIGERLSTRMDELNLKQIDVCRMTGISKNAISNYVNNNRIPDTTSIYKLSKVLKVSIEWILGDWENLKPQNNFDGLLFFESEASYNDSNLTLTDDEINMILRHRDGELIIVDKKHHLLKGEIGELSELEVDLILKLRNLDQRVQEDVYDNLCWRYEREHHKKISYESKIG